MADEIYDSTNLQFWEVPIEFDMSRSPIPRLEVEEIQAAVGGMDLTTEAGLIELYSYVALNFPGQQALIPQVAKVLPGPDVQIVTTICAGLVRAGMMPGSNPVVNDQVDLSFLSFTQAVGAPHGLSTWEDEDAFLKFQHAADIGYSLRCLMLSRGSWVEKHMRRPSRFEDEIEKIDGPRAAKALQMSRVGSAISAGIRFGIPIKELRDNLLAFVVEEHEEPWYMS